MTTPHDPNFCHHMTTPRGCTHQAQEEHDYIQWLKGGGVKLAEEMTGDLAPLKEYWNNPSLSADEKFLRDYILNKNYLEPDQMRY
jgi:hypothetical protein